MAVLIQWSSIKLCCGFINGTLKSVLLWFMAEIETRYVVVAVTWQTKQTVLFCII